MSNTSKPLSTRLFKSMGRYLIVHVMVFAFICIESWATMFFLPVVGILFASVSWLVYGVWLLWRIIQLLRQPSRELRRFDSVPITEEQATS